MRTFIMTVFTTLSHAIANGVKDGDTVAMEGFTHLIPFAAGHEIIRQQRRRLTLVRMTSFNGLVLIKVNNLNIQVIHIMNL